MSAHVSSQILEAMGTRLAAIAPVSYIPVFALPIETLPAIIVQDIEDETEEQIGYGPLQERHRLSFELFGIIAYRETGFAAEAGVLRAQIEQALLASLNDIRLDGLCRPGLSRPSASFRVDADALQKPVGGWALKFTCAYSLTTSAPDSAI